MDLILFVLIAALFCSVPGAVLTGLVWLILRISRGQRLAASALIAGLLGGLARLVTDSLVIPALGAALALFALAGARRRMPPLPAWPGVAGLLLNLGVAVAWLAGDGPLLRNAAIPRNESPTIGDLRTFVASQAAYAAVNGGLQGEPECLLDPRAPGCALAGREDATPFVDRVVGVKMGYLRTFRAGPRPSPAEIERARAAPRSLRAWALVAVPMRVGETGRRGFCADSTGRLCFTPSGSEPRLEPDGLCRLAREEPPPRPVLERFGDRILRRVPETPCLPMP